MRAIFENWLVSAAVNFIIRQITKFGTETDWKQVKADLAARVADIVPGKWLDAEAIRVTDCMVDAAQRAFDKADDEVNVVRMKRISEAVVAEDWEKATDLLKEYMLILWRPSESVDTKAMALVENYKAMA